MCLYLCHLPIHLHLHSIYTYTAADPRSPSIYSTIQAFPLEIRIQLERIESRFRSLLIVSVKRAIAEPTRSWTSATRGGGGRREEKNIFEPRRLCSTHGYKVQYIALLFCPWCFRHSPRSLFREKGPDKVGLEETRPLELVITWLFHPEFSSRTFRGWRPRVSPSFRFFFFL